MRTRKAVITAAGRGARLFPAADTVQKSMYPIVDRDGMTKPVIQVIAEEALDSGIEELCVVCAPGDEEAYIRQFTMLRDTLAGRAERSGLAKQYAERVGVLLDRLSFAVQEQPLGYGHAVYCAKDFVGREPFLLLLNDHLYVSDVAAKRSAQQLLELADREECAVIGVRETREHMIGRYGTVTGKRLPSETGVYQVERLLEKPSLSQAELSLMTAGLRAGHYLCVFGMYVLPHTIFRILEEQMEREDPEGQGHQLTSSLQELARSEKCLALEIRGRRYDIESRFGMLEAQLALSLAGNDRDEVLATVVEVLTQAIRTCDGENGA